MNEKEFSTEISKSIKKQLPNAHYHKIPDQIYNPQARFNPEKKYDAYLTWQGCFTALEYKLHTDINAFPFDKVTLIQRASLLEAKRSGCNAYVVLGIRFGNIRECYFIDIEKFIQMQNTNERKSLQLSELRNKFNSCQWLGSGEWELKKELFLYDGTRIKTLA